MASAMSSKRRSAMALFIASKVATTSPMIQRLTGRAASGALIERLAPTPLPWRKRAAFHNLVAKLR